MNEDKGAGGKRCSGTPGGIGAVRLIGWHLLGGCWLVVGDLTP